jgi:hypothetical protein
MSRRFAVLIVLIPENCEVQQVFDKLLKHFGIQ